MSARASSSAVVGLAFVLIALGGSPLAAQLAKKISESDGPGGVHGFSVSLVLGEMQGVTNGADNLPIKARKALADMRDFLPYKGYRLLDTQWILCCGGNKPAGVSGRLRGLDEISYGFALEVVGASGAKLSLRFALRDDMFRKATGAKLSEDATALEVITANKERERARELLEAMLADTERKGLSSKHPSVVELESKLQRLKNEQDEKPRPAMVPGKGTVIDSTFSMDIGETVVIGTSSLKGDRALIAVLTAVRRPASQPSEQGERR